MNSGRPTVDRQYPCGLGLVLAFIVCGSSMPARSDDTPAPSAPRELTPYEINRPNLTPIAPRVRQVRYSTAGDWQDAISDQCDELAYSDCDQPRGMFGHHCSVKYECYRIKDWFCYIRGYGPTVWDRHGQLWHPRDPYYVRYNNYWRYTHPEPWLETNETRRHLARKEGFAK